MGIMENTSLYTRNIFAPRKLCFETNLNLWHPKPGTNSKIVRRNVIFVVKFEVLLCFALVCFALVCLRCIALLCIALLCFALLCIALLCFALPDSQIPKFSNAQMRAL